MSYLDEITGKDWDENHDEHSLKSEMIEEDTEEMPTEVEEDPRLKNTIHMNGMILLDMDEQAKRIEESMNKYPSMSQDKLIF